MNFDFRLPSSTIEHPYQSSISSSASSSASSVSSIDPASSQSTAPSSYSSASSIHISWENEDPWKASSCRDAEPHATAKRVLPPIWTTETVVPTEQRQHPRRCPSTSQRLPPPLVRQSERKGQFVDSLVDSAAQMVEVIWPLSVPKCQSESATGRGVLPLRTFIQETLRRSRTSYSTLQVALYYLVLIKSHVPRFDFTMEQPEDVQSTRALQCGRRMFLAALILASKYLQDRNYSARAWSKISGLKVCEINSNEMAFLQAVSWKLHIKESTFDKWQQIVIRYAPTSQEPPSPTSPCARWVNEWKAIIPRLTPELDTLEVTSRPRPPFIRNPERTATWPPVLPRVETVLQKEMSSSLRYSPPRFLEPRPEMLPPTPSVPRMAPLPTPQMTPQSNASNTLAASLAVLGSRRSSMCHAMAQAQNASMQRSTFDQWCSVPRASGWQLAGGPPSGSLASSPESMISDASSRSSRASSISSASSVSSVAMAPTPVKLCRLATLRCARQPYPTQQKEAEQNVLCVSCGEAGHSARDCRFSTVKTITLEPLSACEPQSSPDFGSFRISDSSSPSPRMAVSVRTKADREQKSRKRGRSSVDLSLHQQVRDLLAPDQVESFVPRGETVVADTYVADSFLLQTPSATPLPGLSAKALQSPARTVPERRLPIAKDLGRKRACCAHEAMQTSLHRFEGPGMWEGIL